MPRRLGVVAVVLLAACHGPTYPDAPPASGPLVVTPTRLHLTVSPGELPIGGGEAVIDVSASGVQMVPAVAQRVALSATDGTLAIGEAVTDRSGHAKVRWSGQRTATITGTVGNLTATAQVRVNQPATPPTAPPPPTRSPRPPTTPLPPNPAPGPVPDTPDPNLVLTITTIPDDVVVNQPVTFGAALSTVDGTTAPTIGYVVWDFNVDGLPDVTAMSPSRTFTSTGSQRVLVAAVTTGNRSATADVMIDVLATAPIPPPTLSVTLTAPDDDATIPGNSWPEDLAATFTAAVSGLDATSGEVVTTYEWDFDTSTPATDALTPTNVRGHTYATFGIRTARVTATTNTGRAASGTATLTVTSVP
jgi:hypothetical protein